MIAELKSIGDQAGLYFSLRTSGDRHHVKTGLLTEQLLLFEITQRDLGQFMSLGRSYGFLRDPTRQTFARFDFDKTDGVLVAGNDIDLTQARTEILFKDTVALLLKDLKSDPLALMSQITVFGNRHQTQLYVLR